MPLLRAVLAVPRYTASPMAEIARTIASLKRLLTMCPPLRDRFRLSHSQVDLSIPGRSGAALAAPAIAPGYYLPTVSLTLKPFARFLALAFGLCLITRPRFAALETRLLILPTPQWRFRIFALAFVSFRCRTFGTTHFGGLN